MMALVFDGSKSSLAQRSEPQVQGNDALIRVHRAGICKTDLEIIKGYMGFRGVLGHEFVGRVVRCADATWEGKRVVGEINCFCGACSFCREGMGNHCPRRTVLGILGKDGAFAEYLTLPVRNLHPVPDSLSDAEAVFAEPLAAAFEILEQVHVTPNTRALVIGDGKLGLLVAQVLRLAAGEVAVWGRHPENWEVLTRHGVETRPGDGVDPKPEFDLVVDASGSSQGLNAAASALKPRGTLVLKSTVADRAESFNWNRLVIHEIRIVGSRCGPFGPALRALRDRLVDVLPMVQKSFPLGDGLQALGHAGERGVLKVQLAMIP